MCEFDEKPFLVFACGCYYPSGGWNDFVGQYSTFEEAVVAGRDARLDWYQVVDIRIPAIVCER